MDNEEIKKIAEDTLRSTIKEYDWAKRDCLNWYMKSILDSRKFDQDIITLSVGIVGIVIPLLVNSQIAVNKNLLFIAVLLFSVEILFGLYLRFFVSKKELDMWPEKCKNTEEKFLQTIKDLKELKIKPNIELWREKQDIINERYALKNVEKAELVIGKILNTSWFFRLFVIAFLLFIFSLYPLFINGNQRGLEKDYNTYYGTQRFSN